MKLAPLLAQYLYDKKELRLTGVGTFTLDPSARIHIDPQHISEGISFQFDHYVTEDESLVNYISAETGKMKALASSDLSSYVELALQFLNIGKPFQIEGIGTLVKAQTGELEFTPDHLLIDKVKESGIKELSATSISDNSLTTYETLKPHGEHSSGSKKVLVTFLALATGAVIIWAGYKVYKTDSINKKVADEQVMEEPVSSADTAHYVSLAPDTSRISTKPTEFTGSNGNYRFVIEVASKKRAYYRYQVLKKGNLPIQIGTTDSVNYKLFFVLPARATDTARIADSLSVWYPAVNKKKAFVE